MSPFDVSSAVFPRPSNPRDATAAGPTSRSHSTLSRRSVPRSSGTPTEDGPAPVRRSASGAGLHPRDVELRIAASVWPGGRAFGRHDAWTFPWPPARRSRDAPVVRAIQLSQKLEPLLENLVVGGEVRDRPLEPNVLDLKLLQSVGFPGLHAAVLVLPAIERGLADPDGLNGLGNAATCSEQGVGLAELVHGLSETVPGSLHLLESHGPNRSPQGIS